MGIWDFYWEWIRRTWVPSLGALKWLQWVAAAVSLVLTSAPFDLKERFPFLLTLPPWLADFLTIGPYFVFAVLLGFNFLTAPYLIFRETRAKLRIAEATLAPKASKAKFGEFLQEGERIMSITRKKKLPEEDVPSRFENFDKEVSAYIAENCDPHVGAIYRSESGLRDFGDDVRPFFHTSAAIKSYRRLGFRVQRIKEILDKHIS